MSARERTILTRDVHSWAPVSSRVHSRALRLETRQVPGGTARPTRLSNRPVAITFDNRHSIPTLCLLPGLSNDELRQTYPPLRYEASRMRKPRKTAEIVVWATRLIALLTAILVLVHKLHR
jgi:hypothetical protein